PHESSITCGVRGERDRIADLAVFAPVARDNLLLQAPGTIRDDRVPGEDVGGAAIAVVPRRPDDHAIVGAVAGHGDRPAEVVARRPIIRDELLLLGPGAAASGEDVGGAGRGARSVRPDQSA